MAKKILTGLALILSISSLLGYIYFKDKLKSPPNLVTVYGESTEVDIIWSKSEASDRAGMFVPVRISGIPDTLYMQFDLGAVYSILYNRTLNELYKKYPNTITPNEPYIKSLDISLNALTLHYDSIKNIQYGDTIDWNNQNKKIIIGTIGTDFLEKVKALFDYQKSKAVFFTAIPKFTINKKISSFEFNERRIMIEVEIDGENKKLMWDTGASAYELITSKSNYTLLATKPINEVVEEANQLSRKLKVHTASSDKTIRMGDQDLKLKHVTYVEGFPWFIHVIFYFSGMEGMIGNNLFRDRTIYIDAENEKFLLF